MAEQLFGVLLAGNWEEAEDALMMAGLLVFFFFITLKPRVE